MTLQEDLDEFDWFHAIEFGQACSRGRGRPANWSLYATLEHLGDLDLDGAVCLDIGTMDGLAAFVCHERRAARVVATDLFERPQFRLAREILGYPVDYIPNTHFDHFHQVFGPAEFDVIVFAGVLYHVASPLGSLMTVRHHLKSGGFAIVETVVAPGDEPVLYVNPATDPPKVPEYTTYFVPTISAVEAMMQLALLEPVATSPTSNGNRVTVLGRAGLPTDDVDRPPFMQEILDRLARPGAQMMTELDFSQLGKPDQPRSRVNYNGRVGTSVLDIGSFVTDLSLQPTRERLAALDAG